MRPSYALVTPARNEVENLPRLARSLVAQTHRPEVWVIVDSGSTDETASLARELAEEHSWIEVDGVHVHADGPTRANATLRAFESGVETLDGRADVVVKLDADISFAGDYFQRLMQAFADDPQLGMASGTCYEREGGWQQRHVTADHVWGASRAYRRRCLDDVWPLDDNLSWDRVDEVKAALAGWHTRTVVDLPFYHHRREGEREGSRARAWRTNGDSAHYLGYRFEYLLLRSLNHARRDPYALAMIGGFVGAVARGRGRHPDRNVRSYIRREQSLRQLPLRMREALGKGS